jgi:hypothetical protein
VLKHAVQGVNNNGRLGHLTRLDARAQRTADHPLVGRLIAASAKAESW